MSSTSPLGLSGLISGLNTQQLVQNILKLQGVPLQPVQQQLSTLQGQDAAWLDLNTSLLNLSNDTTALSTSLFGALTATSSSTAVTATAGSGAIAGTYTVAAGNGSTSPMAAAEEDYTSSTASASAMTISSTTDALNLQGTFQINGTSITISSSNSLTDIENAINNANAGVTASIISPTSSTYALVIQGNKTGSANAITYADDQTNQPLTKLGLLAAPTDTSAANVAVKAQDAKVTVNGIAIDSPSNTLTGAIPGVTLTLASLASGDTATVTVAPDTQGVVNAVQTFVNDYNTAISKINTYGGKGGALEGQALLTGLSLNLGSIVMGVSQSTAPAGFQSLSDIGLSINTTSHDGTLTLDTAKLQTALAQNPTAVENLFTSGAGLSTLMGSELTYLTDPNTGAIPSQEQSDSQEESNLQTQLSQLQATQQQQAQTLTAEFAQMEQALSQLQTQGTAIAALVGGLSSSSSSSSSSSTSGGVLKL